MNNVTTTKTITTKYVTKHIVSPKFGSFICAEEYKNDRLRHQCFRPEKPFHFGYESKNMVFYYFGGDIEPLALQKAYRDGKPLKEKLIRNLETFNDFNNLYCPWFGMDGQLYRITEKYALPTKEKIEVWGIAYDLKKVKEHLESVKEVSDIYIHDNCCANYELSGKQTLYFDYLPSRKMIKKLSEMDFFDKNYFIINKLKLNKFKYKREE